MLQTALALKVRETCSSSCCNDLLRETLVIKSHTQKLITSHTGKLIAMKVAFSVVLTIKRVTIIIWVTNILFLKTMRRGLNLRRVIN
jgi:hypothetical protein